MKSVITLFPDWQSEIEQLYREDADFQETCQDYEQVRTLLATWTTQTCISSDIIDEYQTLLKDLETEMMEALQARFGTAGS